MSKPPTSSKHQEALQILDDLDNLSSSELPKGAPLSTDPPDSSSGHAADVLAFIDEVTQKSAEPTRTSTSRITISRPESRSSNTPSLRKKSTEVSRSTTPVATQTPLSSSTSPGVQGHPTAQTASKATESNSTVSGSGSTWGWSSVWSNTASALQQARSVVDEQVKSLSTNEQARKLQEGVYGYMKQAQLDKLGRDLKDVSLTTLTDIFNAVAPPISEHEVLKVWLSHDMQGYDGIESIVYKALSRVMQQVDGGDLIVNRGNESKPKTTNAGKREINYVDGLDAAHKLSQASIDELTKLQSSPEPKPASNSLNPTSYTALFLRVQPFSTMSQSGDAGKEESKSTSLQFLIHLTEPSHSLTHTAVTQAVPVQWLDVWDTNEWVEDLIVEALGLGVQVVGQEYVIARMGLSSKTTKAVPGGVPSNPPA